MEYGEKRPQRARLRRVYVPSPCLRRLRHLHAFLPEAEEIAGGLFCRGFDAVAGPGRTPPRARARRVADVQGVPFIAVDEGFLHAFTPRSAVLSLAVDHTGMHYDPAAPSDLENLLQHGHIGEDLLARARVAMDWIRHARISRYSGGFEPWRGRPFRRLVVDGGDESLLKKMMSDALRGCPAEQVAVLSRHERNHALAAQCGVQVIDGNHNPWDLLDHAQCVFTESDHIGFEALVAGREVRCYGMPFYAGWGATQDEARCPRRTRARGVEEIFAAAYILYARYVNPFTGAPSTLEDTLALLCDLARREKRALKDAYALGFGPWKWPFTHHFTGGRLRFRPWVSKKAARKKTVLVWASRVPKLRKRGRLPANANFVRMEDGFVRSRGLGAHHVRPWSLVVDRRGIYYDPRRPSDLEHMLEHEDMPAGLLHRAARIREKLVEDSISKYNTGTVKAPQVDAGGRRVVLVPGQVEDDASIRTGTQGVRTNLSLLMAARAARPDAFIIYKPHPDVENAGREGAIPDEEALRHCDRVLRDGSIACLWPVVDEVHTMTSLAGFEALLRGKDVTVYGKPFYAGWGLTQDRCAFPRRTRRRTLDELVAAALVLYPSYFDWKTRQPCTVETVIDRLAAGK